MRSLKLGSAGMRGEVGSGITPPGAIRFASALGTWLDGGKVVVGTDTRISSTMLKMASMAGLLSCGCEVVDADVCPAPILHFATAKEDVDGALLIGAGHHPAGWNAIVPLSSTGAYFNAVQSQELLDIYHSAVFKSCRWNALGRSSPFKRELYHEYLDTLLARLDLAAIAKAKFRVVADFCNGSGSVLASALAKRLGVELIPINDLRSGVLPHDPEPRPRSSFQVKSIMAPLKADIGFVFNSDMSRVAIVTDSGETLSEEYSFPLAADHFLEKAGPGSGVVTNWCSTRTLDDIVFRRGGTLYKTKVGQAAIIDKMFETGAIIAGDGSGSIAFASGSPGFDGFAVMAVILESMALRGKSSSTLASELPRRHIIKRSVRCQSAHAYSLLRGFRDKFKGVPCNEEDGLRFDWKDGWLHLRASMTEPIIRMIVEWDDRDGAENMALEVRSILDRLVYS